MSLLRKKHRPPEKFIGYYELLEALGKPGCALCRRINDSARSAIDSLFYESVTDPPIRAELRLTMGFCNRHARLALANSDALGLSIIYEDLISHLLAEIERKNLLTKHYPTNCLVCQLAHETEELALRNCRDHFSDEELQAALQNADAFCVLHFSLFFDQMPKDKNRELLRQCQQKKLKALHENLAEFIRKKDYRFQHEKITEQEACAWRRAMELFVGTLQV